MKVMNTKPKTPSNAELDRKLDRAARSVAKFGMQALIYDFSPVPFTPEGELITPTVLASRNIPGEMERLWCSGGFYQLDPVQKIALGRARPVYWSYHADESSELSERGNIPAEVASFLRERKLARGITVAVRGGTRGLATVTGIWNERPPERRLDNELAAAFTLMAHELQDEIMASINDEAMMTTAVRLTPREMECLRLCAEGRPDKQVAHALDRSLSTVIMHMQSAMKKLGARNRAQTLARAAHYGLLDPVPSCRPNL